MNREAVEPEFPGARGTSGVGGGAEGVRSCGSYIPELDLPAGLGVRLGTRALAFPFLTFLEPSLSPGSDNGYSLRGDFARDTAETPLFSILEAGPVSGVRLCPWSLSEELARREIVNG